MATTINDAFDAIDQYMAKQGKGQNYLAKKFTELFEDADSPLNVQKGPLKLVADKLVKMGISVDTLDGVFVAMEIKARSILSDLSSTALADLNSAAGRLSAKIIAYTKALKIPDPLKNPRGGPKGVSMTTYRRFLGAVMRIDSNIDSINNIIIEMNKKVGRERILPGPTSSTSTDASYRKTNINLFSNNRSSSGADARSGGGFLSSIISTVLFGAAAFLGIGMVGKFLSNSPMGRVVVDFAKDAFKSIGNAFSEYITSGKAGEHIDATFETIRSVYTTVVDGLSSYIEKNKDNIYNLFKGVGTSFNKHIATPLMEGAQNAYNKGDYTTLITGGLGLAGFYKILTKLPVLKQIHQYIISPLFKTFVGSPLMNIVRSMGAAVAPKIIAVMSKLGIVGGIVTGLYVIYDRLSVVAESIKNISETFRENDEINANVNASMSSALKKQFDKSTKIVKDLELEALHRELTIGEKELMRLEKLKIDRTQAEMERQKTVDKMGKDWFWHDGSDTKRLSELDNKIKDINKSVEFFNKNKSPYFNLTETQKANNEKLHADAVANNIVNKIRNPSNSQIISPNRESPLVLQKNAEITKQINGKFEELMSTLTAGFGSLAIVTAQGSGQVSQAVVSTAGGSSSGSGAPVVMSGIDPVRRHRDNTRRHVENGR
jgi:hypothetical protein